MRKRRWMICAALVCLAMACGGCADKKKEANTAVIEGDDIKEYSSGTDTSRDTEKDADYDDIKTSDDNVLTVNSPLVGVFYSSASPEADAYVAIGDRVKKGQVIGIVEAMKLMNEIESDYDGVVTDILVDNEQMVEYGQPMFVIKPV